VDGGLAIDTSLHHANDIEYDSLGRFFLSYYHLPIVVRVDTDSRVHLVAGTQTVGNAGDGAAATMAQLSVPSGVEPDGNGGFYVSDTDANVVRWVDPQGIIHTVAGDGTQNCCAPGGLDPCPPNTVSCYTGDHGLGTKARLWGPARLKLGPDGALYVCETVNHVVRRLYPDGTIDTFAGNGTRGYSGDNAPATQAQLNGPYDIRFAPSGDAYVADTNNQVIRRIDSHGIITSVVGNGMGAFAGDGGPAAASALFLPSSIIFDAQGSMWIADKANQRVRRVWHYLDTVPPS
jgi:streptogramin lyase